MTGGAVSDQGGFRLAPQHDVARLAAEFRKNGRLRIRNFLSDAQPLAEHLRGRVDWRQVLNAGEKIYELDRETRETMAEERRSALDAAVYQGAQEGFQFRFESIRVPDDGATRRRAADPLTAFARWMSDGAARAFLRTVTGDSAIEFADAQATRFEPGDFLTAHDDEVAGKGRRAAYVLGLTPVWRPDWGGLLLFHDGPDRLTGMVPAFNVLDIFAVPVPHSVSLVSPAATAPRLSVTGWLRTGP